MKALLRSPLMSAAVGGVTVAGVLLALGVTGRREIRTVIVEAPLAGQRASDVASGLTPYDIYEHDSRGVVFVRTNVAPNVQNPFTVSSAQISGLSTGAGFVVDRLGDIFTNYHLIEGAGPAGISVEMQPGITVTARVMGVEPSQDLAILRVDAHRVRLRPLELGNSATARVGDPTLAIGDPFGFDRTLSTGIVSALQRQIPAPNGFAIDHVIQTDAPVIAGTSGGPLIDAAGRVIGINSQIHSDVDADGPPIAFAVPINTATALLRRVGVREATAYLGVGGMTIDSALGGIGVRAHHGVLVESVDPAGPAAQVGLRPGTVKRVVDGRAVYVGGDVIERVNGTAANSVSALSQAVAAKRPGQAISLTVLRDRKVQTITVTLTTGPTGG
jgi:S1-C subfamily serine protease